MWTMAHQITGVSIVCSTVCSGADKKHQSSASLALAARGIHCWPVNSPHKGPETQKYFHLRTSSCQWQMLDDLRSTEVFKHQARDLAMMDCAWNTEFSSLTEWVALLSHNNSLEFWQSSGNFQIIFISITPFFHISCNCISHIARQILFYLSHEIMLGCLYGNESNHPNYHFYIYPRYMK